MQKPIPIKLLLCAISILLISKRSTAQALSRIEENGKIGYIDSTGKVIIQPIFRAANDFAEGLASARINGRYGFIDTTGKFVIEPSFDYATSFSEGLAIAFKDGKPFYIDKAGNRAFAGQFKYLDPFIRGKAKVGTGTHQGYVNRKGELIIDTVYSSLQPFVQGQTLAKQFDKKKSGKSYEKPDYAIIDSTGQFIVPFGKYDEIKHMSGGYYQVEIPKQPNSPKNSSKTGFIDKSGTLAFTWNNKNESSVAEDVHCGMIKMYLYKYWLPREIGTWSSSDSYTGFLDINGKLVVNDTNYKYADNFSDNRSFVNGDGFEYSLVNTRGQIVADKAFDGIIHPGFKNGFAFVRPKGTDKWGIIDTNAKFVVEPKYDDIEETGLVENYFFFKGRSGDNGKMLIGIARTDGTTIVEPIMESVDETGFKNGVIMCIINGKPCYINKRGELVWQQKSSAQDAADLNIDYMNRGYFYATSEGHKKDLGGFSHSQNVAKSIPGGNDNGLVLSVIKNDSIKIKKEYSGLSVQLRNNSSHNYFFHAQDSRLYMKVQAKNEHGEWKDIEYLPNSWCGNSYHTLTLKPHQYWNFVTPQYEGDFKTKLRIELTYMEKEPEGRRGGEEKVIYSNEYAGSINPGQFWRKETYHPMGLMDPYND